MNRTQTWVGDSAPHLGSGVSGRPRVLLLCDYNPFDAATVADHIDAVRRFSRYDVYVLSIRPDIPAGIDLDAFDAIIVHYSVVAAYDTYLSPLARWRIRQSPAVKAAFIQDEYRFIHLTHDALRALEVEVLFTCVPEDQVPLVYPPTELPALKRSVTVLTGYVTPELLQRPVRPYDARPVDIGYRARRNPFWLGRLAQEKSEIADRVNRDVPAWPGLATDISCEDSDRIYGTEWVDWLASCKAVLGVESGASVFDFDGDIEAQVRSYLSDHPGATFTEVHERILAPHDGRIRLNQISPRCFEAAALGTLMVLYEGEYSGVLTPWRHYVPLKKDHSNFADAVAAVRDPDTWARITGAARVEVAENPLWQWSAMVGRVDDGLALGHRSSAPGRVDRGRFAAIAEQSFRATQPYRPAGGAARATSVWSRIARITRLARLDPIAYTRMKSRDPHASTLSTLARRASAVLYWSLRPSSWRLWRQFVSSQELLDELAAVRALQWQGRAALQLGGDSPFTLLVPAERPLTVEIRVAEDRDDAPSSGGARVVIGAEHRFFMPDWVRPGVQPALSRLLRDDADLVRRLVTAGRWTSSRPERRDRESRWT